MDCFERQRISLNGFCLMRDFQDGLGGGYWVILPYVCLNIP
jgi:hypothetical protein